LAWMQKRELIPPSQEELERRYLHTEDFERKGIEWDKKENKLLEEYKSKYPKEGEELTRRMNNSFPNNWKSLLPKYTPKDAANATRNFSEKVLNALAPTMTELVGGSADLTPSTKTLLKCSRDFQKNSRDGRYFRFGVREHAMAAIGNGMSAYGGLIPYTATFLNFIEYCFPAVRLAAISEHQQIFVMTHDSIGLGEDGPTHQPIEALSICRATPNIITIRPADGNETSGAYLVAMENKTGPTVLALTRQNVRNLPNTSIEGVTKGGYPIVDPESKEENKSKIDVILISTGSETSIAVDSAVILTDKHKLKVRVVSMPSPELFDRQSVEYRRSVITPGVPTVSIEALSLSGWHKYSHYQIGMTTFGASAPYEKVYDKFGLTGPHIANSVVQFLENSKKELGVMGLPLSYSALATHYSSSTLSKTHSGH